MAIKSKRGQQSERLERRASHSNTNSGTTFVSFHFIQFDFILSSPSLLLVLANHCAAVRGAILEQKRAIYLYFTSEKAFIIIAQTSCAELNRTAAAAAAAAANADRAAHPTHPPVCVG